MKNKVRVYLFAAILLACGGPLLGSAVFMSDVLDSALSISFNSRMENLISDSQGNLKKLAQLDPSNKDEYRKYFDRNQDVQFVFANQNLAVSQVRRSLFYYFIVCAGGAALLAFSMSFFLNRRISRMYGMTFDELAEQKDRVRFLENINQWQNIAKHLAHEIKNPLTPIEMAIRHLTTVTEQTSDEVREVARQTQAIVGEEIDHLRRLVHNFASFSTLPSPRLEETDLGDFLKDFVRRYANVWPEAEIKIHVPEQACRLNLDAGLLRQVFTNLVQNALEANPDVQVPIEMTLIRHSSSYIVRVQNKGVAIHEENLEKIFAPYFSTKVQSENMGLGLAIARKIVIEMGGDMRALANKTGAEFELRFELKGV